MNDASKPELLALLPIKGMVVFPGVEYPVVVGRPRSRAAVEHALGGEDKLLVVVTQRDDGVDDPGRDDLFTVGTRAVIRRMERQPNGAFTLTVRGLERVLIRDIDAGRPHLQVQFDALPLPDDSGDDNEAMHRQVLDQVTEMDGLMTGNWPKGLLGHLMEAQDDPLLQMFTICSVLGMDVARQQEILEARSRRDIFTRVHEYLNHELRVLNLQRQIATRAVENINEEQRRHLLRRQMEEIQKELGDTDPQQVELAGLREKIAAANLPEAAARAANAELARLERLSPQTQDYQWARAYLELILELPWNAATTYSLDLAGARGILDADHFDLKEVKDRIIEYLAMRKLNPQSRGAILCFVGGPGVGKTSLGESIARAMGRKFERISLGGLHDESELRGHRRTYVGAMPGRVIKAIQRTGVNNPVLMLDEIDKVGHDFRGDPAAALMEILDPAQNNQFHDNYLDIPFDLSNVMFVATANTLDTIPRPLLDRMEVLRLSGYTEDEKLQIARRYLLPRQLDEVKLTADQITVPDAVLREVIRHYTREAGVRELNRQIARLVRKSALPFAEGVTNKVTLSEAQVADLLGPERFFVDSLRHTGVPGVATGLAWTEAGGDVLFVEAVLLPGSKGLTLTGQLGDVMKESAQAAWSHVQSQAESLQIEAGKFKDNGVHIHVPAGAIPKDGPSAGVTMATALLSLYGGKAVRGDTAMTGEITLAGLVLPVGGIKEKVLAAHRAGITRVILPRDNMKDLAELDEGVRRAMEFIPAATLKDVFQAALS